MKPLLTLLCLLIYFHTTRGQDLKNTEWIQIKAERKDGSRIMDRNYSSTAALKYYFTDSIAFSAQNEQYAKPLQYTIHDNILSMGDYLNYNIDTINNVLMLLTEIPLQPLPDDKINSYVFIKKNLLFDYLKQENKLTLIEDSIIETNEAFCPVYKGNLSDLIQTEYTSYFLDAKVKGHLILSPRGDVTNVFIDPDSYLSKKESKRFADILYSTSYQWSMPATSKPFSFLVDFSCEFSFKRNSGMFIFSLHPKKQKKVPYTSLGSIPSSEKHFAKGMNLLKVQNWEKALTEFKKCIELDSFYVDAYYNEAACYQQLGQMESACQVWQALKEMGQKQGEVMYDENCGSMQPAKKE